MNTQYRMIPEICKVSNIVSHCNMRMRILLPEREQMTYLEHGFGAPPIILDGLLNDFQLNDVTQEILWLDPYV